MQLNVIAMVSRVAQANTTAGRVARLAGPQRVCVRVSHVPGHGNGGAAWAAVCACLRRPWPSHGDRGQTLQPFGNVSYTLFKASQKPISMLQLLNQLFNTRDGMLGH